MHAVRHRPHPFEEALSAESELGWHEPLAHPLEDAVPFVLASAATGLVLAARVAMRSSECRERALDMIVAGRAGVRVAVVVEPLAVAQVLPELERVTRSLRAPDSTARGVAAAQRLLCDGRSSMFGRDAERLREDLHRVAYLLSDRVDSPR